MFIYKLPKQYVTDALKTASKRAIQKTGEITGDLIGNKITKMSKTWPKNSSEEIGSETENIWLDKEIPK